MKINMQKRIYFTVDVECHDINKLNQYITGKIRNGNCGLEKILQMGREMGVPINVFLDIPECRQYGDDYIQTLVNLINKYNQPIYLHVHPDYVYGDKRKHLWEYTKEEQCDILKICIDKYEHFCGKKERLVFRAGAWGVNADTYEVLHELKNNVVDLSFVNKSRWRCHLSNKELGAQNASRVFRQVVLLPNTTFNGFKYFGHEYAFGMSVPDTTYDEFKRIMDLNKLHNITYTAHSWDFMKKFFWLPNHISQDYMLINRFKKCVSYAKKSGYVFSSLDSYEYYEEDDQFIDLCSSIPGKIRGLWNNYVRFSRNGRSYEKYFALYIIPYIIVFALIVLISIALSS